jgi:small subunit ribosomal protein S8
MVNTLWNISANLKNNQIARRHFFFQPKTKLTIAFLNILWNEGFILGYKIDNSDSSLLKIFLKFKKKDPVINSIKFVFKPSRNICYSVSQLWKLDSKKSLIVLTTSKGLMTAHECKKTQTGGKPLFIIR